MKPPKIVQQWIRYAQKDLNLAKATLELSTTYKTTSAFLAQQSAEKAIKGYLAFCKTRFPKTHNMVQLMDQVSQINPMLAKKIKQAGTLTHYAVTYRYPDAERKPLTVGKARSAINIASVTLEECLKAIRGR